MKREWQYFWGKLSDERFFHFAQFQRERGESGEERRYSHLSLNGEFYEGDWESGKFFINTPPLQLEMWPQSPPIYHSLTVNSHHYSLPFLTGEGWLGNESVTVNGWFEFESFDDPSPPDWEWISLKLNNDVAVIAYNRKRDPFAKFIFKNNVIETSFRIESSLLYLDDLSSYYLMEPINPEVIFHPKNGRSYSEQPFNVISNGRQIGYGIRERTYKEVV